MKKLYGLIIGLICFTGAFSQAPVISQVYFNAGISYVPGGSISIHFNPTGVYPLKNKFTLELLDATGTVVVNPNIGQVNEFFVPVLNGSLPSGLAPGNYRLRVVATDINGSVIAASAVSPVFTVTAAPVLPPPTIGNPSLTLKINCYSPPNYFFGYVDRASTDLTAANTLSITNYSPSNTYTVKLITKTGTIINLPVTIAFGTASLTLPAGLATDYYTLEVTATNGAVSTSYSYIYQFNTGNTSLGNTSSENVCTNEVVHFAADLNVLLKNYPGSLYTINYGDGSPTDTLTHAEMLQNALEHTYSIPTCLANIPGGAYQVTLFLYNKGKQASTCDSFSKNGNGTFKYVNTSAAPIAVAQAPVFACLNQPLTVENLSIAGFYGTGTGCERNINVTWFVRSPTSGSYIALPVSWSATANRNLLIPVNILSQPGTWHFKIVTQNPEGCISTSEDSVAVCVEAPMVPDFKMNGLDSISNCAPYSISITNLTNGNICRPVAYSWSILDSSNQPAAFTSYGISNDTTRNPVINFLVPGRYSVVLSVSNSCGTVTQVKPVNINGITNVDMPSSKKYCETNRTILFGSDPSHKPIYNQTAGPSDTYNWSVTGGPFSFVNGTSASVRYPDIQFTGYGNYTVTLTYTNSCGSKTVNQQISFYEPVTVNAGAASRTICYNQDSIHLSGSFTGAADSVKWTAYAPSNPSATGSFSNSSSVSSIYTLSTQDKNRGEVWLILKAFKQQVSPCSNVSDTLKLIIRPRITADDATTSVCNGDAVAYTPSGNTAGAVYTWTSSVTSGTVTGNTNGNGTINDILLNNTNNSGTVQYKLVPSFNGCSGDTGILTVTVNPTPVVTVPANSVICRDASTGSFSFSSTVSGTIYSWSNSDPSIGLAATGTGNINSFTAVNNTATDKVATITVTPSANSCAGAAKTFTITVKPGPPASDAGPDQYLCAAANTTLAAVAPVSATGTWTQIGSTSATIVNPSSAVTQVTSLVSNTVYSFVWTVSDASSCPSTTDTVRIFNRPNVTAANAGNDTSYCSYTSVFTHPLNANGPVHTWENGSWSIVANTTGLTPSFANATDPSTNLSGIGLSAGNNSGVLTLVWRITNDASCAPSTDTVLIKIYRKPVAGTIAPLNEVCKNSNVVLNLNNYQGNILKWRVRSAPFASAVYADSLITSNTLGLNNLQDSVMVQAIVKSTGSECLVTDTVTAVIPVNAPSVGGTTLKDSVYCAGNATGFVTLSGYKGNISWQRSVDNGVNWINIPVISNPSLPYNNLLQSTWFRAIVTNGACASDTSSITKITVTGTAGASDAGADKRLCAADSAVLTGNPAPGAIYKWRQITGPAISHSDSTQSSMTVYGLQPAQLYRFEYALSNAVCTASKDTVSVIAYAALVNKITPLADTVCNGQVVNFASAALSGGDPTQYIYQWQTSADAITWTNAGTASTFSLTATASVYVRRFVNADPCSGFSDTAHIVVEPGIGNNVISDNDTICINTAAPLISGTTPTGGNGIYNFQWQQSSNGGLTWNNISGATAKDYQPPALSQTMKYRRLVSDSRCGSAQSNVVTILVRPDAIAAFNPTTLTGCTPFTLTPAIINLQQDATKNAQYLWYVNNVLIGSGVNFPGYTLINDGDTAIVKLKTISLYGCNNDSISKTFVTYPEPAPAFDLSTASGCGPLGVTITNTTPKANAFTYLWDFGNGQTSIAKDPGTVVFQPAPTYHDTTYNISLKVFSACDTITVVKPVLVKAKAKALFAPDRTVGCSPMKVIFTNNSLGNVTGYTWDFGDGTIVNTSLRDTISHIFHTGVRDTFYVKLRATNGCGTDTLQYAIIVSANTIDLDFAVNGNQQQGCAVHNVSFINNSQGGVNFFWNFGDGNSLNTTKNIDTVSHVFPTPGIYQVTLRATNGCSDTTGTETITVYPKPIASFTRSAASVCVGSAVNFTNTSDSATSYIWQFGDGNNSILTNPSHTYSTPGIYTVLLTALRVNAPGNTCTDTISKQITVTGSTPASFLASDTVAACAPFTATFTNPVTPANSVTWNFGDGQTGTGNIVSHTFSAKGNYTVTMTRVVPGGCTYIGNKQIVVGGPEGQLIYSGGYLCGNGDARFEVMASGTDSVKWNFGDGQTITTTQNVVYHHYNNAGFYVPSVTLKSNAGCQIIISGTDTIRVDKTFGGFTTSQLRSCGSTAVNFTDTSHVFFGKANVQWFFGDGNSATGNNVNHVYTTGGPYAIMRIVTSNSGCKDTITTNINVIINTKPDAAIVAPLTGCVGQQVNFAANVTSNDPVALVKWTLSNGITGNAANLPVVFSTSGVYNVQLIAGTTNGCFDTTQQNITINPSPNVIASNNVVLCKGNSAPLNAIGTTQYQWSPTQGLNCTTCPNPVATPQVTTSYVVQGTNSFGCSATDTVVITVMQPFNMNVSPNDSICIGASSTLVASGATTYSWTPAISLNNAAVSNPVATPSATTPYRVVGYDGANCFTDTAFVTIAVGQYPVVNLGADQLVASGTVFSFAPAITNGPIVNYSWTPSRGLDCATCPKPNATIEKDITYKVTVTNNFGCSAEDSIHFTTFCKDAQTFIPNAFTPDGDGINDILMVRGSGIVTVKSFRIFNRWGEVVFERANFPPNNPAYGWDGKINGKAGPPDVFVYTAEVVCGNGTSFTYKGNVSIIK